MRQISMTNRQIYLTTSHFEMTRSDGHANLTMSHINLTTSHIHLLLTQMPYGYDQYFSQCMPFVPSLTQGPCGSLIMTR